MVYLKKARHEIRKMMSSPSYSTPHDTLETKKQFVYVPQKQISSLQPSIFRGKHFIKFLPSVTSGINTSQQHRLPISRVTQKCETKKGRKGQTIWREPQKKHISALWVKFHPKRWSCFIFEWCDFFFDDFFSRCSGLATVERFRTTRISRRARNSWGPLFMIFWAPLLGGGWFRWLLRAYSTQVFLYLSEPGVGSDTPRISTNCTELWLRIVTNQSPLFQRSFLFSHPCFVASKICFRTSFSYGNSWFEKPPWIRQWIRHEENLPTFHEISWLFNDGILLLMFIVLDQQKHTFSATKKIIGWLWGFRLVVYAHLLRTRRGFCSTKHHVELTTFFKVCSTFW